ncbi:MAG TPA: ammonia-forming cytochrome c nitrite reductase subunit c552 [Geobacteraceae bacterium]|nr:ammonia-forming cytochrome c nitrite reductase subunit c552 [Geobacteraceae bacterium]
MKRKLLPVLVVLLLAGFLPVWHGFSPRRAESLEKALIAEGTIDPAVWGQAYPLQYEMWKKTGEPTEKGLSKYKRGFDADRITYDKLAEFPYMALLFNGWGFGVEYNEPRGHAFMVRDQLEVDPSRVKAGGVCLTCKTPYAVQLQREMGKSYYSLPYKDVLAKIPEKDRQLGVACIDCHNSSDMSLRLSRQFTLGAALRDIGKDPDKLTKTEMRSLVCAQCHVTYDIIKDKEMKSVGVFFPWQGSKWGGITIENIIRKIRSDPSYLEWKQGVTGFKMGFIRHPEFEMFSNNSVHWKAGVTCADCHMPQVEMNGQKVSDHRVMSPLKNNLKACGACHAESPDYLREQVIAIQDRTVSLMLRSGYATTTAAKLFEITHKAQANGKKIDPALYDKAKDYYQEAFYRCVFVGAENSVGFHNPTETMRILGDATAFATKTEALLRQALAQAGINVPIRVDLELNKYLDQRGAKKLKFNPKMEFKDPTGVQVEF